MDNVKSMNSPEPRAQSPELTTFLMKCCELAQLGESRAFPNPIVGAVIVNNDEIIGQGFHVYYGGPHAEVNAIEDAKTNYANSNSLQKQYSSAQAMLEDSSIYVSLEPCNHHGKTPPCSDLIIQHKFKSLIFASYDPNPQVARQGIKKIKAAGIEVIEPDDLDPELVKQANYLNRVFFKTITNPGSAYITVKIASTSDGRMITEPDEPRWITNSNSRKQVHRLRSIHQLLITGINTVINDDPLLTVRHSPQELKLESITNPDIAILKSSNDFSDQQRSELKIFQDHNRQVNEYKLKQKSAEELQNFINTMVSQGYRKILVEAGPRLAHAFIKADIVDEIIHYEASTNGPEIILNRYREAGLINNDQIHVYSPEIINNKGDTNICIKILKTNCNSSVFR